MKIELNYPQVELLFRNEPDMPLIKSIHPNNFLITFLKNIQERMSFWNFNFDIHPSSSFQEDQMVPLLIDDIEVGEIHLSYNSSTKNHSLVYYTASELIDIVVMDFTYYSEFSISDYFIVLYEFCFILESQRRLYEKI